MAIKRILDTTLNDSDKTFTVPGGETWKVLYGHVILTSTATVGNRQVRIQISDSNSVTVTDVHVGATQAASLTRDYEFMQGIFRETAFVDGAIQAPIPADLILLPGWTMRVYDVTAVDAAADDMTVSFVINTHVV